MRADLLEVTSWLNSQGRALNNCFQIEMGAGQLGWQVNCRWIDQLSRGSSEGHHFAKGYSLAEALTKLVTDLGGEITAPHTPLGAAEGVMEEFSAAHARARAILDAVAPLSDDEMVL